MLTHHIITIAYIMYEFTYTAFSIGQNIEMKRSVVARGHHELLGWRQYESGLLQGDETTLHHDFSDGTKTCTSDKISELCIKKSAYKANISDYHLYFSNTLSISIFQYIYNIYNYICYNTIPCCCPVAVDIRDLLYLNTSRFSNANHISAACQHSGVKWDRGNVSTRRALSSMHQSLTTPLKQLKSKELALFQRPCLYFLFFGILPLVLLY